LGRDVVGEECVGRDLQLGVRPGWIRPQGATAHVRRRRPLQLLSKGSAMASNIRVATDVGGTFTDLVFFQDDPVTGEQQVFTSKADTTPPDFERGVLGVLNKAGLEGRDVSMMTHGTTVVINALTERTGVKT